MRTFILGAGADVVKFTVVTRDNENNITNFDTNADKLKLGNTNFTGSSSATDLTAAVKDDTLAANTIYVGTYANIASLKTTGNGGSSTTNSHVAIVTEGDNKLGEIYYIADDVSGASKAVDLVKIGSIDNVASLTVSNFDFTA